MARICFVLVAGLDAELLAKASAASRLKVLAALKHRAAYQPAFPAVTCTTQATLTTGAWPAQHGIICNGLYTHHHPFLKLHLDMSSHADVRANVTFWEQSNSLMERERFWNKHTAGPVAKKKVAMLFWQNSMPQPKTGAQPAADFVVTPKPQHTPDGKTIPGCWSAPPGLYPTLADKFGPFPLQHYWGPMAGLASSQWIARAAVHVWREHAPDLQLVYIPHLDYNLQRLGPNDPAIVKDLEDVDALLSELAAAVHSSGGILMIAGDYGMSEVSRAALPNLVLRDAGLLMTKLDPRGKVVVDHANSAAFAMCDHQIAHVYVKPNRQADALQALAALPGVERILKDPHELAEVHLANARTGNLVLLSTPDAWFAHDWWLDDAEKPAWQFAVDIHNKPGYDPRELFFDRERQCIAQDLSLPKGSHGLVAQDHAKWPVLLSDAEIPAGTTAASLAAWLKGILG